MRALLCLLLAGSVVVPAAAAPSPVYLECSHTEGAGDKPTALTITLVESESAATYSFDGGPGVKADAAFTASDVSFQRVSSLSFMDTIVKYRVDRSTLTVTREMTMLYYDGPQAGTKEVKVETGTCTLAKPPADRKF